METAEAFYDAATAPPDSTAERIFELRWAKRLTADALNSLSEELTLEGKRTLFEQLKAFLTGGSVVPSYDEVSARTGLPSESIASMLLILELQGHVKPHAGGRFGRMH